MANKQQQQRMEAIVKRFQEYVETYTSQAYYKNYSDTIFLDDMVYGIGLALDDAGYKGADGYDKFKALLLAHLTREQRN
jgi:hypothetical protein